MSPVSKGPLLDSDLLPLPHESLFSMLARIARANLCNASQASELFLGKPRSTRMPFLCYERGGRSAEFVRRRLANRTDWPMTAIHPTELASLDTYHGVWFDRNLVLCPHCIGHRYHSHWHQLLGLQLCPWHGTPLQRACQYCDTPFRPYAASMSMFHSLYSCHHCHAAYHPDVFALETGALWKEAEVIDRAFSGYRQWARRVAATLRHYEVRHQWSENCIEQWWTVDEAMRAMADLAGPSPPGCQSLTGGVTHYVWPLRPSAGLGARDTLYESAWNTHQATHVYTATLEDLRTWILDTHRLPKKAGLSPQIFQNNAIQIGNWPPAALAYMLLRLTWECPDTWSPAAKIRVRQMVEPSRVQQLWHVVYEPRTTRVLTFATFAALYWMIKRADGPTLPRYRGDDRITTAYLGHAGRLRFGAVWFPTIPGLLEEEARDPRYLNLAAL